MKNDKIVNSFNAVQPSDAVKKRVFDNVLKKQNKKRPIFKVAASFATAAAVICLLAFGSMLLLPQDNNLFAIKAYAMEVQEDDSVQLREVDIVDTQQESWGGYINEETNTMYIGIGLRCEGENIESVEFSTGNGFFAQQYVDDLSEITTAVYIGPDNQMVILGMDFENVGSTISLSKERADDYLLFWGIDCTDISESFSELPKEVTVHAKVTFDNGKTAEQDITINKPEFCVFVSMQSEEQRVQDQKDFEAYMALLQSIPLDQCEIVSDSVQTLTYGETYDYRLSDPDTIGYIPITEESMDTAPFDQNDIFRINANLPSDGSDGYIAVIERNEDGTLTGMVYKVPGLLIQEYMK